MSAVLEQKKFVGTALRILNFMGAGMKSEQAAEACGVDPSYVSQLWADESFKEQVEELRLKGTSDKVEVDLTYDRIEKTSVKRLEMMVAAMTDPMKLIAIAKFANEAKRKAPFNPAANDDGTGARTVKLVMPLAITNNTQFVLNPNREVVAVEGRDLTTMTPKMLEAKLTERAENAPPKLARGQPITVL